MLSASYFTGVGQGQLYEGQQEVRDEEYMLGPDCEGPGGPWPGGSGGAAEDV